ncbi:MAG: hypothetical protein HY403_11145 [Elusimicrobia bacterium]|nr:hypothetical protein [Elusimicrobiota bacterium]
MKYLRALVLLTLSLASARAALPVPDRAGPRRGGFDWTAFEGKYDFGACRSRPGPIWGDYPPGAFVLIEPRRDYTRQPVVESLEIIRASHRSPLALGWQMDGIGLGPQQRRDPDTGRVNGAWESYPTADGVYGVLMWDNPHNVGWSTFQLTMDARGGVRYEMRQKRDTDPVVREETCTLQPQPTRVIGIPVFF